MQREEQAKAQVQQEAKRAKSLALATLTRCPCENL